MKWEHFGGNGEKSGVEEDSVECREEENESNASTSTVLIMSIAILCGQGSKDSERASKSGTTDVLGKLVLDKTLTVMKTYTWFEREANDQKHRPS